MILVDQIVTLHASQSSYSESSSELRLRIDQLSQQVGLLEEDKKELIREKDEIQQQLIKQKDRTLEAEKDSGYRDSCCFSNCRRFKSSLAALEGEAGGQAKGEMIQLQKTIRELTTESKFKDAEIQKLKDVTSCHSACLTISW
jgi:cell division protein FtsB